MIRASSVRSLALVMVFTSGAAGAAGAQTMQPPPPSALRPYAFPAVEQFQLDNGLKVIVVQKHTLPVVEGRVIIGRSLPRQYSLSVRRQIVARLRSGEPVAAVAAETGVCQATLFR